MSSQLQSPRPSASHPGLTARQAQVLALLAEGCSVKQAARSLGIAHGTAALHVMCLKRRLNLRTTAEAIAWAGRVGLA